MIELYIPAHNEALRIEPTLRAYLDYFSDRDDLRIIVVANACSDNTVEVVNNVRAKHGDKLRVIDIPEQVGKGGAIARSWDASTAEWISFVDADGATAPAQYAKLLEVIAADEKVNGAIASRFIAGAKVIDRQSVLRTTMSKAFIAWTRLLFGMPYTDTQCGAKIIRRSVFTEVSGNVKTTSMAFDVDLLWQCYKAGYVFTEVPTVWADQPGSPTLDARMSFLKQGWRMVKELIRIRFRKVVL